MENNNSGKQVSEATLIQVGKYPKSIRTIFLLYTIWFLVTCLVFTFAGLGIVMFLPISMFFSFIFGLFGLITAIRQRKEMSSNQRLISLFLAILMVTIMIPLFVTTGLVYIIRELFSFL